MVSVYRMLEIQSSLFLEGFLHVCTANAPSLLPGLVESIELLKLLKVLLMNSFMKLNHPLATASITSSLVFFYRSHSDFELFVFQVQPDHKVGVILFLR